MITVFFFVNLFRLILDLCTADGTTHKTTASAAFDWHRILLPQLGHKDRPGRMKEQG